MKIIDISRGILTTPVYPGDPLPSLNSVSKIENGDLYNLSTITACVHTGSHVDAPLHFIADGKSIEQLPLELYIGECIVAEANGMIDANLLSTVETKNKHILLFKGCVEFSPDCCDILSNKGIHTIGTEQNTIGGAETHQKILSAGFGVIENLNLSQVECGQYFLFAPPIKTEGADGAFCRAVLIKD